MEWYLKVLKNYANFEGRARRKEYWMFFLFNTIFAVGATIIDNILGLAIANVGYGPIYIIYGLALLIPGLAVLVRRLHDIGKSGWMIFVALIPLIGGIWLIVLLATEGTTGRNDYGPDPKGAEGGDTNSDLLDDNL